MALSYKKVVYIKFYLTVHHYIEDGKFTKPNLHPQRRLLLIFLRRCIKNKNFLQELNYGRNSVKISTGKKILVITRECSLKMLT